MQCGRWSGVERSGVGRRGGCAESECDRQARGERVIRGSPRRSRGGLRAAPWRHRPARRPRQPRRLSVPAVLLASYSTSTTNVKLSYTITLLHADRTRRTRHSGNKGSRGGRGRGRGRGTREELLLIAFASRTGRSDRQCSAQE